MALRSLLRRIPCPVRLSQSGPLMGPVHGISPAAASRFMATRSQVDTRTNAEIEESINKRLKNIQRNIDEFYSYDEIIKRNLKAMDVALEKRREAREYRGKLAKASFWVMTAMSGLMILSTKL